MQKVKDNNIGLGLSCALDIISELSGDLRINHSSQGFSSFSISLPVTLKRRDQMQAPVEELKYVSQELQTLKDIDLTREVR